MASPEEPAPERRPLPPVPVSFLGLVRASFFLYRQFPRALIGLYLAAFVPYAALSTAAIEATEDNLTAGTIIDSVAILVFALAGSTLVALSAIVLADRLAGTTTTPGAAARVLRPLRRELLAGALLVAVIIMFSVLIPVLSLVIGTLMLGPPIVVHVMVLERRSLGDAWARAKGLLEGHWARVLAYLGTLTFAVNLIQGVLLFALAAAVVEITSDVAAAALIGVFAGILLGLALPILASAGLVLYLDLRARKEDLGPDEFAAERASEPPADATQD